MLTADRESPIHLHSVANQDATRDNGCLWVLPRSHKDGIKRRFVREGETVTFKPPKGSDPDWDLSTFIPVEVPAGTNPDGSSGSVFHSYLVLSSCVVGRSDGAHARQLGAYVL